MWHPSILVRVVVCVEHRGRAVRRSGAVADLVQRCRLRSAAGAGAYARKCLRGYRTALRQRDPFLRLRARAFGSSVPRRTAGRLPRALRRVLWVWCVQHEAVVSLGSLKPADGSAKVPNGTRGTRGTRGG